VLALAAASASASVLAAVSMSASAAGLASASVLAAASASTSVFVKTKLAAWGGRKESASYAVVFFAFPSLRHPSLYADGLSLTHQIGHRQAAMVTPSCF